jgi:hypothetical protein
MWLIAALMTTPQADAADLSHTLSWQLTVRGQPVGKRDLTVKYVKGEGGTNRILESFTDLNGAVGPMKVRYRQRLTAHVDAREPASFHSVVDNNGALMEVQARWTPSAWLVTTTADQRSRTVDMPSNRIDLSTADLMDPYSRLPLSHFDEARILSAETGEVTSGPVEKLGVSDIKIGAETIQVTGYVWTSPQGRSELYYSADGFLVRYTTQLLGIEMEAQLTSPPPGGIDDFPVFVGPPTVEVSSL